MFDQYLTNLPVWYVGKFIEKPAGKVYEAFLSSELATKFWFSYNTGRFEVGKPIHWDWHMDGVSTLVEDKLLESSKRILSDWGLDVSPTAVEWLFSG